MERVAWLDGSNSYATLDLGPPSLALQQITGLSSSWSGASFGDAANAATAGRLAVLVTPVQPRSGWVVGQHVYAVLDYNPTAGLLRLFNPWGVGNGSDGGYLGVTS